MNESCKAIESVTNKLMELRALTIDNNKLVVGIEYKLYNPEPCNTTCANGGSNDNIENLIDEIWNMCKETNNTLNKVNDRL
jgi:hypothetical protein